MFLELWGYISVTLSLLFLFLIKFSLVKFSIFSKIIWSLFYLIVTPILLYYLVVKNNYFSRKIKKLGDSILDRFGRIASTIFYITESVLTVLLIQIFFIGHYRIPTGSMLDTIRPGEHFLVDSVSRHFFAPKRGDIEIFNSMIALNSGHMRLCKRVVALPGERVKIDENGLYIDDLLQSGRYTNYTDREWIVPKRGDVVSVKDLIILYRGSITLIEDVKDLPKGSFSLKFKELNGRIEADVEGEFKILDYGTFTINGVETGPIFDSELYKKILLHGESIVEEDYYYLLGDNTESSFDSRYFGFVSQSKLIGRLFFRIFPLNRLILFK